MTALPPIPRALATAAALLALSTTGCDQASEIPEARVTEAASGQELLDSALAAGCDSQPFMAAVEAFQLAHDAAVDSLDAGFRSEEYGRVLESREAPRMDRVFASAPSLYMNEMHDCQRLIVSAEEDHRYGPLVALFADAATLASPDRDGMVVAEVFNFESAGYAPLGLVGGIHCLWVEADADGVWSAQLLKPAPVVDAPSCLGATPDNSLDALGLKTVVRTVRAAPPGTDPYPSTTRWMWDEASGLQYIGFRCGDAWCEVMPDPVQADPSPFPTSAQVPGWSDSQYLSMVDMAGNLVVSGLFGIMAPGPGVQMGGTAQRDSLVRRPMVGSHVTLRGQDDAARAAYAQKMDFLASPSGPSGGPPVSQERIMMRVVPAAGQPDLWEAWTVSAGDTAAKALHRAVDVSHSGTGTVRWRWSENDEAGWLSCRNGCCSWGLI